MFFKSTIELSAAWRAKVAWAAVATSALILPEGGFATIPKANISVRTRWTASLRRLMPRCPCSTAWRSAATAAGFMTDIPATNAGTGASTASRSERTNPVNPQDSRAW